jgi:uncharacterized protein YndB with AHSA1/START domain
MNEVRAHVTVPLAPERAFELFTRDVDAWWRRGERYGGSDVIGHRFDGHLGGDFVEIMASGEHALGQIHVWEPPVRLLFSWRQSNWGLGEETEVEVTFTQTNAGTAVTLVHRGIEQITSDVGCDVGYEYGWRELVGWFRDAASAPTTTTQRRHDACESVDHEAERRL